MTDLDLDHRLRRAARTLNTATTEVDVMDALSRIEVLGAPERGADRRRGRRAVAAAVALAVAATLAVVAVVLTREDRSAAPAAGFPVSATAPDRFDRQYVTPDYHVWQVGPSTTPSTDHPFVALNLGRLTSVTDPASLRQRPVTAANLDDPPDPAFYTVLARRAVEVDGHRAVQYDLRGSKPVDLVNGHYGDEETRMSSRATVRVTTVAVGNSLYEITGVVDEPLTMPAPGSMGAADYEAFLASVVVDG
jgi:hypothetical protein